MKAGDFILDAVHQPGRPAQDHLHVYLEGDGRPWLTRTLIAKDPTARRPLVPRLMAQDPNPALYLARPCWHGAASRPPCEPWLWTHGRYSEQVVGAMAEALAGFMDSHAYKSMTLIGHSGGGVLAMLLAERSLGVKAVVTIAANLDIAAWAELHGYSELSGSLNPAQRSPLPPTIKQLHLAGEHDSNVPPELIRQALRGQPGVVPRVIAGHAHRCCWAREWPTILSEMTAFDRPNSLEVH